jgi:predicted glycoside hydrolase/deacetylase ChbG (UPF0249 family)
MKFITLVAALVATVAARAAEPGKTYLIIHADDAGMSHSVNRATIDALERGVVSSVSIMVPCPWFKEFAAYAQAHPEYDYGIHLTLNSEWENYRWGPVAPREKVPSLIDDEGYLWDNVPLVAQHAKAAEVKIELRAQIDRARKFGVPLTHLDTHMGALVSRPDLLQVYVDLGIEYDLPVLFLREFTEERKRESPAVVDHAPLLARKLQQNGLPVIDRLAQFYDTEPYEKRRAEYVETLRNLPPGINELIIHCGYADDELRAITNSAERRDGDRRVFTDPEIARLIKGLGIEVITWKQVRQLAETN